jgi:hypothetical protein
LPRRCPSIGRDGYGCGKWKEWFWESAWWQSKSWNQLSKYGNEP